MGTTNVYAITDTHQDTRKTRTLLSEAINGANKSDNVLLLNAGDMFKGIYPKPLEADSYIKAKELSPDMEIVITLGNNDFGFNKEHLDYLISTVQKFANKGIKTVCANIFDSKTNKRPSWIKPYTVVERDGDRTFITGFCIDDINSSGTSLVQKDKSLVEDEIKRAIKEENPDNVIILNHDYLDSSVEIYEDFKKDSLPPDVIIGGHDHTPKGHLHPERHIYYPAAFAQNMLNFKIINSNGKKQIEEPAIIKESDIKINKDMEADIAQYERQTGLLDPIAPSVVDFYKKYSDPCSLGSFLTDEIKEETKTDICLFSTGLTVKPLPYRENGNITNYDFQKTMMAKLPIKKVTMTPNDLKEVLEWSYQKRTKRHKITLCPVLIYRIGWIEQNLLLILFVINGFKPGCFIVRYIGFYRNMGKIAVWCRTMPVFNIKRNFYDIAFFQYSYFFASFLISSFACRNKKDLPA